eukprot:scaffold32740_cov87-Skeletonema_marinoi.AAC.1
MSAGLGVYAAIPGGGSLESSDISRMRRALVAGFIVEVVCYEGKRGTVLAGFLPQLLLLLLLCL